MDRKSMPLIVMLVAGAITCLITFIKHYTVFGKLLSLLIVLIIFYALGSVLKMTLDHFDKENEKKRKAEGEVIEKEGSDTNEEKKE